MPSRLRSRAVVLPVAVLAVASRVYAADTPKESVEEKFAKRAAKLWSLQPISKPAVPVGATTSPNPIDAFVGAVYREKGLHPSAKADKLTLLRRVYFDLIGIPPTIAEQDAFLRDSSPDAYQKVVDRLLANEQHGARWVEPAIDWPPPLLQSDRSSEQMTGPRASVTRIRTGLRGEPFLPQSCGQPHIRSSSRACSPPCKNEKKHSSRSRWNGRVATSEMDRVDSQEPLRASPRLRLRARASRRGVARDKSKTSQEVSRKTSRERNGRGRDAWAIHVASARARRVARERTREGVGPRHSRPAGTLRPDDSSAPGTARLTAGAPSTIPPRPSGSPGVFFPEPPPVSSPLLRSELLLAQNVQPKATTPGVVTDSTAVPTGVTPSAGGSPFSGGMLQMVLMLAIFVPFLFLMTRRQRKEQQARASLKKGDRVTTTGGLIGELVEIDERVAKIKITPTVTVQCVANTVTPYAEAEKAPPRTSKKPRPPRKRSERRGPPETAMPKKPVLALLSGIAAVVLCVIAFLLDGHPLAIVGATAGAVGFAVWRLKNAARRNALIMLALAIGSGALFYHFDNYWGLFTAALAAVWSAFGLLPVMDGPWRMKVGLVAAVFVGAFLALWPTLDGVLPTGAGPSVDLPGWVAPLASAWKAVGSRLRCPAYVRNNETFAIAPGLDLSGGLRLVYTVEVDEAIRDKRDHFAEEMRQQLATSLGLHSGEGRVTRDELGKLEEKGVHVAQPETSLIRLTFKDKADKAKVDDRFTKKFAGELAQSPGPQDNEITFKIRSEVESQIRNRAVAQAKDTVSRRVDELGLREASVTTRDEDIIVEVPGSNEASFLEIKETIRRTARLEFKMVDDSGSEGAFGSPAVKADNLPEGEGIAQYSEMAPDGLESGGHKKSTRAAYVRMSCQPPKYPTESMSECLARLRAWTKTLSIPDDHVVGFEAVMDPVDGTEPLQFKQVGWRTFYLFGRAELTGDYITDADTGQDQQNFGQYYVRLSFSPAGADRFEEVTGANVNRRFAIILDDVVDSAPSSSEDRRRHRDHHDGRGRPREAAPRCQAARARPAFGRVARADHAELRADDRPLARTRRHSRGPQGRAARRERRAPFHGRLLSKVGPRGRRRRALQLDASARVSRGGGRHDDVARHRGSRAHHRYERRRERPHQRANPRRAPLRQERALGRRGGIHAGIAVDRRRSCDRVHLGPHLDAIRHGAGQRVCCHALGRHLVQPVYRGLLHPARLRVVGSRREAEAAQRWRGVQLMEFFKPGRVFDFMGQRWFWIPLSFILVIVSVILSFFPGPNYGTDFRGGTEVDGNLQVFQPLQQVCRQGLASVLDRFWVVLG